jgi:hypothetical protein
MFSLSNCHVCVSSDRGGSAPNDEGYMLLFVCFSFVGGEIAVCFDL